MIVNQLNHGLQIARPLRPGGRGHENRDYRQNAQDRPKEVSFHFRASRPA
jgi:hypothetical protein